MNFRSNRFKQVIPALLTIIGSPSATASPDTSPVTRWVGNKGAVFFGYSAAYHPQFAGSDRFNTGNVSVLEGGVEAKDQVKIGLRYAKTTVPSLEIYDPADFLTSYYPNASLNVIGLFVGFDIPLNQPYGKLGLIQLFLPINAGTALVSVDAGDSAFKAVSLDSSLGLGARIYTESLFRADISALYHFGFPLTTFTDIAPSTSDTKIFNSAGQTMKAGLSGFEIRLGFSFIFSDSEESKQ
ncbi:MAG: hypothetical protein A2X94_07360 [Bdellovibrionales bacterium GWB1_55_8]|nr:MAG: hypothetical protein A2X94_07360 [Bdellovibrionales bacterium GWB1_55_8]